MRESFRSSCDNLQDGWNVLVIAMFTSAIPIEIRQQQKNTNYFLSWLLMVGDNLGINRILGFKTTLIVITFVDSAKQH